MVSANSRKSKPLPVVHNEDHEVWEEVRQRENFRWMFNKLEVALRQGLHAGPAGTAPRESGWYVSRPTYNPYGMGIGAKKFYYDAEKDYESFINHGVVPPGHFWCEWLNGPQLSIDYQLHSNRMWTAKSIWVGTHETDDNLTKFLKWQRYPDEAAPHAYLLPIKFPWEGIDATPEQRTLVPGFNVEMRSNKIIEIHLRHGNDTLDDLPEGTTVTPVWDDEEIPEGAEFRGNLFDDMTKYGASGNLPNIRRGFIITRPSEN